MSPQIGDERDHISVEPDGPDHTRIRIRLSYATVITLLFLFLACGIFAFFMLGGPK